MKAMTALYTLKVDSNAKLKFKTITISCLFDNQYKFNYQITVNTIIY